MDKASTPAGRRIRGLDAQQRRAQRRDDLLDAALDLFASQGYLNTSIEQICQHAYVGTKSFYEVFDGREACFVALLQRIVERASQRLGEVLAGGADDEERTAQALVSAFAHAFVDDIRLAKVTFGAGSAITPQAERQRRENRRWAAGFVESVWQRFGVVSEGSTHGVAIGLIGGLFDIIADWVIDVDEPDPAAIEQLIGRLTSFYGAVRGGMKATG